MKITDGGGKTFYQWKQPKAKQVIKADAAYIVNNMASDPNASYLPGSCTDTNCTPLRSGGYKYHRYNGWQFAIKTGTTNDGYDGLMASWSPKYAVVSWVGHHTRRVNLRSSMENLTEPVTRGMMEYSHTNLKPTNWTQPKTVKTGQAFIVRNHIGFGSREPSPANDLFPGWYVGGSNNVKKSSQVLDKVSNKVATSCTPPLAKDTVYGGSAASWNVDIFNGGKTSVGSSSSSTSSSSTSNATDDVHNCNDSPPTVSLTAPSNCDRSCTITATVTQGTHPLYDAQYSQFPGTITFTLNGQTIHTEKVNDSPTTVSFNYTPSSNGSGTLTASVTDSVLYQGQDSANITYSSTSPITLNLSGSTPSSAYIQWTGGNGPFTAYLNDNPSNCQNVSGNDCTVFGLAPGTNRIFVRDGSGGQSNTVTSD